MIRIHKGDAPERLGKAAGALVRTMADAYEADPASYRDGTRDFQFSASVYASKPVKDQLKNSQHSKCCYCETIIKEPYAFGHVEHYRPKAHSLQDRLSVPDRPGYFWLAYEWENLLMSCHFCNSSSKGNLFPLLVPGDRARSHLDDLDREVPLLIKPDVDDDIEAHIAFYKEIPVALTEKGRRTIEVLKLDSPKHEGRLSHYATLQRAHQIVRELVDSPDPRARAHAEKFRAFLEGSTHPSSEYSALSRQFLVDNPLPATRI